ncbi:MAG: hypothetical protein ACJ8C4_19010 [Gemmataceae bacterium]
MRILWILIVCIGLLTYAITANACPFCNGSGETLSQDVRSASMILFGTLKNARLDPKEYAQGATDLEIEVVIKADPILGDRKVITLPKYWPATDPKNPGKFLVFCDVYQGKIDPYKGFPFKGDSHIASYLKGSLGIKDKDLATRLKFFFDYLDDPDSSIAHDAYNEFSAADYKDFRPIAEKLPADRIIKWLNDPNTPASRYGLYGSMLGHCGKPADAPVLLAIIDDPARRTITGLDGVLAGLTLLTPTEGWRKTSDVLADSKKEHLIRFAALKAAEFLWEFRPDVIPRDQIGESVCRMLEQPDIADLAIEKLGKWNYWKCADRVIALSKKPEFNNNLVHRAIMRYALRCPANSSAVVTAYLTEQRKQHPETVKDMESFLASESGISAPGK